MNEEDLRDCFAMFAMLGIISNSGYTRDSEVERAWEVADKMLEARSQTKEQGIAAAKPKRVRKS